MYGDWGKGIEGSSKGGIGKGRATQVLITTLTTDTDSTTSDLAKEDTLPSGFIDPCCLPFDVKSSNAFTNPRASWPWCLDMPSTIYLNWERSTHERKILALMITLYNIVSLFLSRDIPHGVKFLSRRNPQSLCVLLCL